MMANYIDDDIVVLRRDDGRTWEHYWGDPVEHMPAGDLPGKMRVRMRGEDGRLWDGFISDKTRLRSTPVLWLSMIDVQQGDGLILETPGGKTVLIDGGDNKLFARHAAKRYPGSSDTRPKIVDAIIVTHGDADHFKGLSEIRASESSSKSLFIAPRRIFHNGLVKRPGNLPDNKKRPDVEMFGATRKVDGRTFAIELVDDPRGVVASERNGPFNEWCATLDHWGDRTAAATGKAMEVRRIDHRSGDAFAFLAEEGIQIELHGPIVEDAAGAAGLRFFRKPPKNAALMVGTVAGAGGAVSASHTINGHSISFRMRYGNVRFLMTGDLNHESMQMLREALPDASLATDILKTPHHGSSDFEMNYLLEAAPVVSLISSGDENASKEHIHPRATLMAALGKASRTTPAIIFNTELAAFFAYRGKVTAQSGGPPFDGFQRLNFGIIHIRTDGERVLAFTHSGERGLNEAYRFTVSTTGAVTFADEVVRRAAPRA